MGISAFCHHLRHPFTYTGAQGKTQYLSSKEISRVKIVVLSSLAMGSVEAIYSNRSLKSSFISIGILAGAVFYLATAAMKMVRRGDGSSPKRGEDLLRKKTDPITHTLEVSGFFGDKSGWFPIDNSTNSSGSEPQDTAIVSLEAEERTQGKAKEATKTSMPSEKLSVSQDEVNILEVSGFLGDKSGWFSIDNPINSSGSELMGTKQTIKPSENLGINQDEISNSLLGSATESSVERESIDSPSNFFGLERKELQIAAKVEKKGTQDLTVSVFGLQVNEWVKIDGSPNSSGSEQVGQGIVQVQKLYQQLTLTEKEAAVISQMIQMIGNKSLLVLYYKKEKLLKFGKNIENVHPLKFLETVLNTPLIKTSMLNIHSSYLKWPGFLNGDSSSLGFVAKCIREDLQGNFAPYITDFCEAVKVDSQIVHSLYKEKKWEELISYLVNS